jgi:hypothetical protein
MVEVEEIARDVARRIAESCLEHGDPLPPALSGPNIQAVELRIPVSVA